METNKQAITLLQQAIKLLEGGNPPPTSVTPVNGARVAAKPDEETLDGFIQDPQFRHVGEGNIPLYTAKLDTGQATHSIQAWRKVAEWATGNFPIGAHVRAFGRWEENTWTDRNGEQRTTRKFSVRAFEPL